MERSLCGVSPNSHMSHMHVDSAENKKAGKTDPRERLELNAGAENGGLGSRGGVSEQSGSLCRSAPLSPRECIESVLLVWRVA